MTYLRVLIPHVCNVNINLQGDIYFWFCRWEVFKQQMKDMLHHSDTKGTELKKAGGSLYTFPMPDCMCKQVVPKNLTRGDRWNHRCKQSCL